MRNKKRLYNLLFEADLVDTPESSMIMTNTKMKARQALDSVDDQIDALILRYEASSIREEEEDRAIASLDERSLRYLVEQEEEMPEEDPEDTGDVPDEAEEAPEPSGSEEMTVDTPAAEQAIPDLDLDAFAARTVRLIKNYRSLLRVEEAIGNRIKHFLDENYGDKFVQRYLEILDNQYGLTFKEFEGDKSVEDENYAVGAYAGGAGAGGA